MPHEGQEAQRRETRYNVEVEVHLTDGVKELATRTREISRGGLFVFACPAPPVGKELRVTLYPRGSEVIHLDGRVRYRLPDIGAGVSVAGREAEITRYQTFVDRQAQAVFAWHAIRGFLAEEDVHASSGYYEARELIPIGERCQALRILFERHKGRTPRDALGEEADARLRSEGEALTEVSLERVGLKLHTDDCLRDVLVARTDLDGFVAVIPPADDTGSISLYRLSGREHIAVSAGGRSIFPHFNAGDLLTIKRAQVDVLGSALVSEAAFPRAPSSDVTGEAADASFEREGLSKWCAFDEGIARKLEGLFRVHQHETRVYNIRGVSREVKLLRDLTFEIRSAGADSEQRHARLLHDGRRLCVIEGGDDAHLRVRPLMTGDEVRLAHRSR